MLRCASGVLAVAVAALIVCCSADSHQEQDGSVSSGDRYDASGHKSRTLGSIGGGNLVRQVRELRRNDFLPSIFSRHQLSNWNQLRSAQNPYGKRNIGSYGNFDEIDLSGLDNFQSWRKRNFDEIDQTSMPFPYAIKRFYHLGPNYLDTPVSSFDKKRNRPDYPMDEIDLSHFPIGSKRAYYDNYPMIPKDLY